MHFGRKVVGNLATQTTSVRDFTIAMLGFWFIEQLSATDSVDSELGVFLRWEHLGQETAQRTRLLHGPLD